MHLCRSSVVCGHESHKDTESSDFFLLQLYYNGPYK